MTTLPRVITGTVISGDQIGRTIGFPTANLKTSDISADLEPGVYYAECELREIGEVKPGLAYFGPRLIFGELTNSFEIYLYDFDRDVYGQELAVTLLAFMRPPLQIDSLPELKAQLEHDKQAGLKFQG